MVTHKRIAEVLKCWNMENEMIMDVYYEGSGTRNENAYYIGERHILKVTANLGKLKKHVELTAAIESVGLNTAALVNTAQGEAYVKEGELYFYLTKRVEGKQILAGELYQNDYNEKARFIGEIIGQLHLALKQVEAAIEESNLVETVKSWAFPKTKEAMALSDSFCEEFERVFPELFKKLPRQIIHRDPNPGNILCSEDKWGFIDFELSEKNVRIYDVCYATTAILSESFMASDEIKLKKWLEIYKNIIWGYDSVAKLTENEREAMPYVLLANQFVCVAWFSEQEKYQEVFETNKKMTKWLVENFEELKIDNE